VYWPRSIGGMAPRTFGRRMRGLRFSAVRRRGKYLVFDFDPRDHLLLHLRMSGRLNLHPADQPRNKHEHVVLDLDDGLQLRFQDTRKFGRMLLVADAGSVLDRLGVEPLSKAFTAQTLTGITERCRRMLKPLLLDQTVIAGLGNIYVDEALWDARLHPCRSSQGLSADQVRSLHRAIRKVLRRGLKNMGTSLGSGKANFYSVARRPARNQDELKVFRRTGQPCPRCRTPIQRIIVGQRSTHICPACQISNC
jgi:formamidopyrimidine-DNA glycosylase